MEFSEEWKSLWSVSSVSTPPLLLSGPSLKILGPLSFEPLIETLSVLLSSPFLSPPLPPPCSHSLSRFFAIFDPSSALPPSLGSSIAADFGPHYASPSPTIARNQLRLLRCSRDTVIAFFSSGENSDQVAYVLLSVQGSDLKAPTSNNGSVFMAAEKLAHPITSISVNPYVDFSQRCSNISESLHHLMVSTLYSIHWFRVEFKQRGLHAESPVLKLLGTKAFKSCAVVHACWSPHLREESVVLLESGELFLFDLGSGSMNEKFKGVRVRPSWDNSDSSCQFVWLSCEFSWHPRVLIVARSDAVFLVDMRGGESKVSCLAKVELFSTTVVEKDRFIAFSMAGFDGFYFVLGSKHWLLLFDIRRPWMPLLQWAHRLDYPCFIDVFKLSELKAHPEHDLYNWSSESGYCIIMGSFWTCEFGLFCYGPALPANRTSVSSAVSKFCRSLYAWGLPSNFSVLGHGCACGSCLLREEFSKDALPVWINWQQKKEIVLGFAILDADLSDLISVPDSSGGFTLIRLMSSGKLELQRYSASWGYPPKCGVVHDDDSPLQYKDALLYPSGEEEYRFARRFKYFKLDYLNAYLNGNLTEVLVFNMKKHFQVSTGTDSDENFHEHVCEQLRAFGIVAGSFVEPSVFFMDACSPTSMREVAMRKLWAGLPTAFLQAAFSKYSEILDVLMDTKAPALEFLAIPDRPQLPPFFLRKPSCRSNKWSHKVRRSDDLVGPVLPLPILLILRVVYKNNPPHLDQEVKEFSPELEILNQSGDLLTAAKEIAVSVSGSEVHEHNAICLADDTEKAWASSHGPKSFLLYNQVDGCCFEDSIQGNSFSSSSTFISKLAEKSGVPNSDAQMDEDELFANLCPIDLKVDSQAVKPGPKEFSAYKLLHRQYSKWQEDFSPYQEFCTLSRDIPSTL